MAVIARLVLNLGVQKRLMDLNRDPINGCKSVVGSLISILVELHHIHESSAVDHI